MNFSPEQCRKSFLPHLHDSDENVSKISTRKFFFYLRAFSVAHNSKWLFLRCVISEMENSIWGREKSFFSFATLMWRRIRRCHQWSSGKTRKHFHCDRNKNVSKVCEPFFLFNPTSWRFIWSWVRGRNAIKFKANFYSIWDSRRDFAPKFTEICARFSFEFQWEA